MKWYILLSVLFVHGAMLCMDGSQNRSDQVQSNQQQRRIDCKLLELYLNTINTKRNLAHMFLEMPTKVSEMSDEQVLFKKNLLKDYTRVNNLQAIIMKNIKRTGFNIDDDGMNTDSSRVRDLIKSEYHDDATYQTSLARSRQ